MSCNHFELFGDVRVSASVNFHDSYLRSSEAISPTDPHAIRINTSVAPVTGEDQQGMLQLTVITLFIILHGLFQFLLFSLCLLYILVVFVRLKADYQLLFIIINDLLIELLVFAESDQF